MGEVVFLNYKARKDRREKAKEFISAFSAPLFNSALKNTVFFISASLQLDPDLGGNPIFNHQGRQERQDIKKLSVFSVLSG